jgi:hypothetical protein
MYGKGIFVSQDKSLLFVAGGYWKDSTVDKQSVIILKADI